jgi:hypothetical protein
MAALLVSLPFSTPAELDSTETGNYFAGTMTLTNTGDDRYSDLPMFNNTSDGAQGGSGVVGFSPVGLPIVGLSASVPVGGMDGADTDPIEGSAFSSTSWWGNFANAIPAALDQSATARINAIGNAGLQFLYTIGDIENDAIFDASFFAGYWTTGSTNWGISINDGYASDLGQAINSGRIDPLSASYVNMSAQNVLNAVSFGVYDEAKAGIQWGMGEISTDQLGDRLAVGGVMNLVSAASMPGEANPTLFGGAGDDLMASRGAATSSNSLVTRTDILDAAESTADTVVKFGPHVEGPLSGDVASTFRGGSYSQTTLGADTTLYRVYGGNAGELGSYWTRTPPSGPLQSTIDSALNPAWGNTAQNVATIKVPAGTTIYEGFAAPQGGLVGGGSQVFIPKVNPGWVVPKP